MSAMAKTLYKLDLSFIVITSLSTHDPVTTESVTCIDLQPLHHFDHVITHIGMNKTFLDHLDCHMPSRVKLYATSAVPQWKQQIRCVHLVYVTGGDSKTTPVPL